MYQVIVAQQSQRLFEALADCVDLLWRQRLEIVVAQIVSNHQSAGLEKTLTFPGKRADLDHVGQ
ncbi:MAG: hypothetical protein ACLQU2_17770 [Candidatus Binataceae bacterium]